MANLREDAAKAWEARLAEEEDEEIKRSRRITRELRDLLGRILPQVYVDRMVEKPNRVHPLVVIDGVGFTCGDRSNVTWAVLIARCPICHEAVVDEHYPIKSLADVGYRLAAWPWGHNCGRGNTCPQVKD
jgi:hypothetical protein